MLKIKYTVKMKYFDIRTGSPTFRVFIKQRQYNFSSEVRIILYIHIYICHEYIRHWYKEININENKSRNSHFCKRF